ncbi:unnamed protein product [Adineta steineri]|uniref:Uncharacterized protein n=1 Tax=Adineta steineri TaxID=433720 RepID=A0A815T3P6_9BILA|nr:unnamed protein product [Adineta steineri]CAF1644023.1 unnamed protein product [Adineta steineri]
MLLTRFSIVTILFIIGIHGIILLKLGRINFVQKSTINKTTPYSYYLCTQIFNESDLYLTEWIEFQLNVIGFKNICLINVGENLNKTLLSRYSINIINKKERQQEFHYCLACLNQSMKSNDLLFIQDVDEFLNVRQADIIYKNYDKYDKFHFQEIRYGYIYDTNKEMINRSLLETNIYRKPHEALGEFSSDDLRKLFNCKIRDKWYSCHEGHGKEMIKVGKIKQLGTHFHQSTPKVNGTGDTLFVQMRHIRLNHYVMRTREDGIQQAIKWNKGESKLGLIYSNNYFKLIFDDTIQDSKRLL